MGRRVVPATVIPIRPSVTIEAPMVVTPAPRHLEDRADGDSGLLVTRRPGSHPGGSDMASKMSLAADLSDALVDLRGVVVCLDALAEHVTGSAPTALPMLARTVERAVTAVEHAQDALDAAARAERPAGA